MTLEPISFIGFGNKKFIKLHEELKVTLWLPSGEEQWQGSERTHI